MKEITLTSNTEVARYTAAIMDAANAAQERLTHNAHVVIVNGRSYRAHGAAKTHATQGGAQIGNA